MDFTLSDNPGSVIFVTWVVLFMFPFVVGVIGVDVCPAVKAPNSNTFISYDFQHQAATLEEAVANFVDPTAQNPFRASTLYGTFPDGQIRQRCSTLDCLNCYDLLSEKLRPFVQNLPSVSSLPNGALLDLKRPKTCKNLLTSVSNVLPTNLQKVTTDTGSRVIVNGGHTTNNQIMTNLAPVVAIQGQLGNGYTSTQAPSLVSINDVIRLAGLVDQGQQQNSKMTNLSEISSNSSVSSSMHDQDHGFRPKRDTASSAADVQISKLGVRTTLNCKYKRGDPVDTNGDQSSGKTLAVSMAGLCNLCWTLRTLPSRYFPRFLSELSCDDGHPPNGTTCLAGQGTCVERLRQLDVLYNQGSESAPVWNRQSLGTVSSCECRVPTTSAIYSLVKN